MARKNPLGKIKDLTKGAASIGLHVAGQATKQATSLTAGAVGKLVQGKKLPTAPAPETRTPATEVPETKAPKKKAPASKPVATPAPEPAAEPVTSIDAAADVEQVDVTPADIADKLARKAPARPAAKKAPAKKTSPGAKLPPRKKIEEPQPADTTGAADKG